MLLDSFITLKPIDDTKDFIIFFPGLNLKSLAFEEMAIDIDQEHKKNILFYKHDPRESLILESKKLLATYQQLKKSYPASRFTNIAHSYGAILCLPTQSDVNIFFAPAFKTKGIVTFSFNILKSLPSFQVPSFNLKKYRLLSSLSSKRYQELRDLQENLSFPNKQTLLILNKKDEFIDSKATEQLLCDYGLSNWSVKYISKENGLKENQHLAIDRHTLDRFSYEGIIKDIKDFIPTSHRFQDK